jgi:hypothetical protein
MSAHVLFYKTLEENIKQKKNNKKEKEKKIQEIFVKKIKVSL